MTLIELAIALAISALIATTLLQTIGRKQAVSSVSGAMRQADVVQDALLGFIAANLYFPAPDAAGTASSVAGGSSGWLPAGQLGLPTGLRVRYLVDSTLTQAPSQAYNADPDNLAQHMLPARSATNIVDLCFVLAHKLVAPGLALNEVPIVAAFVVGTAVSSDASYQSAGFLLPGSKQANQMLKSGIVFRALGANELFSSLNCPGRISGVASAALTVAVTNDLLSIAQADVAYRTLRVASATESVLNDELKLAILGVQLTWTVSDLVGTGISFVINLPTGEVSPGGVLNSIGTGQILTFLILSTSSIITSLQVTQANFVVDTQGVPIAQADLDNAMSFESKISGLLANSQVEYTQSMSGIYAP